MKQKRLFVFIGVLSIISGCLFYLLFFQSPITMQQSGEKNTVLKFIQDTLNLGDIKLGEKREVVFKYTNTGEYPLIIKNVQTSCGCTEVQWNKQPLFSGGSDEIKIIFNAEHEGFFLKSTFIVCNIWKKVYPVHIKGMVITR